MKAMDFLQLLPPSVLEALAGQAHGSQPRAAPIVPGVLATALKEFVDDSTQFIGAVDWTEPFISILIAFHVILLTWILVTRNVYSYTAFNFLGVGLLILAMKPINYLGAQYHGSFSRTNYFDAHGVFMGVMWAAPLLLDMMLLMGLLLRQSAQMLVKVKTQQFQKQRAQKMKSAAGQSKNADGPKQEVKERKRPSKLEPPADTPEPQISLLPHILHWSITTYRRVFSSSQTAGPPSRLDINSTAARKPAHVAVSFRGSNVPDAQTVIRVATWCMDHNVRVLTVHDASGVLKTMAESIADSSSITTQVLVAGIPLKPSSQPSAHPMLYVNIVSDNEGRAALVDVARTFAADPSAPQVTVESVDTALRAGKVPLPTPEPNLVFLTHTHSDSIQIGNFLPWDIRLSEFTAIPGDLTHAAFVEGLDRYATCQQRFGK